MPELSFWDRQMKFAEILPDFAQCLDRMATRSDAITLPLKRHSTGGDPRQWVEIAETGNTGPVTPVFVHGGYWRALEAEVHRFVLPGLAALGATVANVEYRLMPDARMADLVQDVSTALEVVASQCPGPILPVGHSAGAHLITMAARDGAAHGRLAGCVGVSGVYDLASVPLCFVQQEINLTTTEQALYSLTAPAQQVPPMLFVTGADETYEFRRQAALASALQSASWIEMPGMHHMTVLDTLESPEADLVNAIADWLARQASTTDAG